MPFYWLATGDAGAPFFQAAENNLGRWGLNRSVFITHLRGDP